VAQYAPLNTGFFRYFTDGSFLGSFTAF
jgi:hypothetical protein